MKKLLLALLMLCNTLALAGCTQDGTKLLDTANENMKNWSSYGFEMQTMADINIDHLGHAKLVSVSEAVAIAKPFQMEMMSHITMEGNESPSQEVSLQQYVEEENNAFTLYQNSQGNWQKAVLNNEGLKNSLCRKPADILAVYLQSMKSSTIIGSETLNGIPCTKVSLTLSAPAVSQLLNSFMAAQYLGLTDDIILNENLELTTILWIGKKDSQIYKQELDLSPVLKELLAQWDTEETPTDLSQVIMNMSILYYDINEIVTIDIPDEAKKNPA